MDAYTLFIKFFMFHTTHVVKMIFLHIFRLVIALINDTRATSASLIILLYRMYILDVNIL